MGTGQSLLLKSLLQIKLHLAHLKTSKMVMFALLTNSLNHYQQLTSHPTKEKWLQKRSWTRAKLKQRKRKRRKRKIRKLQQKKRQTLQWKRLRMPVSWRKVEKRKRKERRRIISTTQCIICNMFPICIPSGRNHLAFVIRYATSYHVNYEILQYIFS